MRILSTFWWAEGQSPESSGFGVKFWWVNQTAGADLHTVLSLVIHAIILEKLESFGRHTMLSRLSKLPTVNFSLKKQNTALVWMGTGRTWQILWHQGMRRVLRDFPSPRSWATYVQLDFSCFLGSKRPSFSPRYSHACERKWHMLNFCARIV